MLEAGEISKCKDLNDLQEPYCDEVSSFLKCLVLWGVARMQWLVHNKSGLRKDNW